MKTVLTFGASTSKNSINVSLANYASQQLKHATPRLLDLNDFEMPIYSVDREKELGFPQQAKDFGKAIADADGILVSLAEHNGTYTAAFKNILDWSSRVYGGKLWQNKPMLILSTSPGGRGGQTVKDLAVAHWPFMAADVVGSFSLPFFQKHFTADGITDAELDKAFQEAISSFDRIFAK